MEVVETRADVIGALKSAEREWVRIQRQWRRKSNSRIRAVNDARDNGMSLPQIATVMHSVHEELGTGRKIRSSDVSNILTNGYPIDEDEEEAS